MRLLRLPILTLVLALALPASSLPALAIGGIGISDGLEPPTEAELPVAPDRIVPTLQHHTYCSAWQGEDGRWERVCCQETHQGSRYCWREMWVCDQGGCRYYESRAVRFHSYDCSACAA